MRLSQFHIGLDFWCGGKRWRCTDVGSRVVVAISLEPHEVVSLEVDPRDALKRTDRRYETDDPSWLIGPPYAIVEQVFDEDSMIACRPSPEHTMAFLFVYGSLKQGFANEHVNAVVDDNYLGRRVASNRNVTRVSLSLVLVFLNH